MPPGHTRPKPTFPVLERATAETCLAIAKRVEADCQNYGDRPGMEAAHRIAELVQQEVLVVGFGRVSGAGPR